MHVSCLDPGKKMNHERLLSWRLKGAVWEWYSGCPAPTQNTDGMVKSHAESTLLKLTEGTVRGWGTESSPVGMGWSWEIKLEK